MNCPKCGIEIAEGSRFCNNCGALIPEVEVQQTQAVNPATVQSSQSTAQPVVQSTQSTPPVQPTQSTIIEKRIIEVPIEYKPISAWGYFWYSVLFGIPIVGLVFLIVYAVGGTRNINLKNFARGHFCGLLIGVIIAVIVLIIFLLARAL